MTAILVGIPILKDARRFHVQKGRRWTVFEHLLLEALAKKDWSVDQLVEASDLPRRVVIEILVRLMRAGWVQLISSGTNVEFAATPRGRAYATRPELPPITRPESRFISYTFELVTGAVFRVRDLAPATDDQWHRRSAGRPSVLITGPSEPYQALPDVRLLADTLLEADEELIRVDVQDWRPRKRIGVVTVRGDKIEGLGAPPSPQLHSAIVTAAKQASTPGRADAQVSVHSPQLRIRMRENRRPIQFRLEDLLLGGEPHRVAFRHAISRARHRLLIHSTFISVDKGREAIEMLKTPVQKGAHIDILWGQSSERDGVNDTRRAADTLRDYVASCGLSGRIRIHTSSTRSHAKILLYDEGNPAQFTAIVGSCNWLSSEFESFEASIRLREEGIVADIAYELAELARPRDGQIPDLCAEMVRLGRMLERCHKDDGRASAQVILGSEHARCILDARDNATERILILSHRLGANAKPVLKPLAAAALKGHVAPEVFYGRLSGKVEPGATSDELFHAREAGVEVTPVHKPRLHAKLLAWDNDDVVITSQNWLSADPGDANPRQEIGIHIVAPGVARIAIERFKIARDFS